jgi:hypothetical protein
MTSTWRHPAGDDNIGAAAPLAENSACITQASLTDPFNRQRLAIDGQIGSGPVVGSAHSYGSREHSEYSLFGSAAALMTRCALVCHWR